MNTLFRLGATVALGFLAAGLAAGAASAQAPPPPQSYTGTLETGDKTREGGMLTDRYTFHASAYQIVSVKMTSDAFDTYLIVTSPSGIASENDDATEGSQVDLITSEEGEWTVQATSYGEGMNGAYKLDIALGPVGQASTREGRLDRRDSQSIKGEYYDAVKLQLTAGSDYYVELSSLGFDGYIALQSPTGTFTRNDDAGSTELARVGPISGAAGDWTAYVTSVAGDEVGAYDLRVIKFPEGSRAVFPSAAPEEENDDSPREEPAAPAAPAAPNRAGGNG